MADRGRVGAPPAIFVTLVPALPPAQCAHGSRPARLPSHTRVAFRRPLHDAVVWYFVPVRVMKAVWDPEATCRLSPEWSSTASAAATTTSSACTTTPSARNSCWGARGHTTAASPAESAPALGVETVAPVAQGRPGGVRTGEATSGLTLGAAGILVGTVGSFNAQTAHVCDGNLTVKVSNLDRQG